MPKFTVITEGGRYEFENDSVENVGALVAQIGPTIGLSANASLAVNGAAATASTPLADGDEVTATKPAGRKGTRK